MGKHNYVVKVPKPAPGSYNPNRPITSLVRNQILHLSLAERHLSKAERSGIDIYSIKTEREASEYIHHLTRKLHPQGSKPPKSRSIGKPKPRTAKTAPNQKRRAQRGK